MCSPSQIARSTGVDAFLQSKLALGPSCAAACAARRQAAASVRSSMAFPHGTERHYCGAGAYCHHAPGEHSFRSAREDPPVMLHLRFETWSVAFPEDWEHDIEDDILAIATPAGESVLQIGSMSKDEGAVTDDDLWEFMDDAGVESEEIQRVKLGDFEGLSARTQEEALQLRYWVMRAGDVLLLATFRSPIDRAEAEMGTVESVLQSLRLEPAAAPAKPH